MNRVSQRIWIGLVALAGVWIVTYWLTPSPAQPIVSTPDELRVAAGRAEQRLADDARTAQQAQADSPSPIVTIAPRPTPQPTSPASNNPAQPDDPANPTPPTPDFDPNAIIPPTFQIYTASADDTMSSIAERFYGTPTYAGQIARANPTIDPVRLRPGTEIKVPTDPRNIQGIPADPALQPGDPEPAFTEYVVVSNDTLSAIAKSFYGKSILWTHIRDANPQINQQGTNLRPGMTIRLPPPPAPRHD